VKSLKSKSDPSIAPRLLTIPQTARYLSSTVWAIRQLQWSRTVPFIRLGARILFDINDLNQFIDAQKVGAR
jgi:hypothetical protein